MPLPELAKERNDSQENVRIFPTHIPVELLRYILEISATLDRKTTACAIVLSSKLLRNWIDPILYRTVTLHSTECGAAFAASIEARLGRNSQTTFFKRSVKLLSISSHVATADITSILNACTGVSTLHLWNLDDVEEGTDSPMSAHDLTSLTVLRYFNCNFMATASLSPTITHIILSYHDASEMQSVNWLDLFGHCPAITHLMLFASAETREELALFQKDPDPTRLAEDILHAYSQVHSDWSLQLVLVPFALVVLSLVHAPSEWVADVRPVKDGGNLLLVYPSSVLDDFDEHELQVIWTTQMDPVDLRDLESDDKDASRCLMHRFPGIHSDLWDFIERTARAANGQSLGKVF
ncbi:hypothetical protein BDZ89DRAFT_1065388 [Hymenopellis radicata]|nr:hypothetical protein BDZ89DRAFT_1065388 [Hymenopellis radicata]